MFNSSITRIHNEFSAMSEVDFERFCNNRCKYVLTRGEDDHGRILFADGAMIVHSHTDYKRFVDVPQDDYETAKLVHEYWYIVATRARRQFQEYKQYLGGNGKCPEGLKRYTDDEKIEVLKQLQKEARRTHRKFSDAEKELDEVTPAWMRDAANSEEQDIANNAEFQRRIEHIDL